MDSALQRRVTVPRGVCIALAFTTLFLSGYAWAEIYSGLGLVIGFQIILTIIQWTAIVAAAARSASACRSCEAVALTVAMILVVGIVGSVSLLLLGYPIWFQGI